MSYKSIPEKLVNYSHKIIQSSIVSDPLRGFTGDLQQWLGFSKFYVMCPTRIDLYGIAQVKVELLRLHKIYTSGNKGSHDRPVYEVYVKNKVK